MRLHLVSLDRAFVASARELFGHHATVEYCDIASVPYDNTAFVSPANSLGIMDGGIDLVLSRDMFPGCEEHVQTMIHRLGERPYLHVGSALWLRVGPATALIVAPTMFMPHDVADTQNAYWAFLATLMAADRIEKTTGGAVNTLVCTSLCCGVGRMDPEESAIQLRQAWDDFHAGHIPEEIRMDMGPQYVLLPPRDD
jgi:O-acetyl-ADP-ribose deacetylase (regulator of RNase III)